MSKSVKSKPRLGRGLSSLISVSELPVEVDVSESSPSAAGATSDLAAEASGRAVAPSRGDSVPDRSGTNERHPRSPSSSAPEHAASTSPAEIPLDRISPNPHQPRRSMHEAQLAELSASLRTTGLIQPIVVRQVGQQYELIAGERRWRAAKLAGLATIPAYVRQVDAFTQAQMALVENIQREDLNPIDRAQAYRTLIDQLGLTQAELASRLGEDRSTIANFVRLLDLQDSVKMLVRDSRLSLGHAKLLAGVVDPIEQARLAELCVNQDLSVRNLERMLQNEPVAPPVQPSGGKSAHVLDLERNLTRQLGMKVQLRTTAKKGRGRLIIHYTTLDQFDDLLQKLGVTPDE